MGRFFCVSKFSFPIRTFAAIIKSYSPLKIPNNLIINNIKSSLCVLIS